MLSLLWENVTDGEDVCLEVKPKRSLAIYNGTKALHDHVLPHIQDMSACSLKMWFPEPQLRRRTGVERKASGDLDA